MESMRRRLQPHHQPARLADNPPRRNREPVDERRQRMTQILHLPDAILPVGLRTPAGGRSLRVAQVAAERTRA